MSLKSFPAWPRLAGACVLAVSIVLPLSPAHAQSRRDRAKIEVLKRDLAGAEARYRAAVGEPQASAAAVAQMEAAIAACAQQRGCELAEFLQVYRGALQAGTKEPQELDVGGGDDPIDFTADDVPPEAGADVLLDERNRRFAQAVQFNPAVQAGIRRWLTDMRPSLMQSFENYQYLRPLMAPAFR